jgi:hypothetical protein
MKCDIIERTYLIAIDSEGNEYVLKDTAVNGFPVNDETLIEKDVEGEVEIVEEQDRYDDGSYSRTYTEIRYFNREKKLTWQEREMGKELTTCQSGSDGECNHPMCPQLRDGEPEKTGRSCPLYDWDREDD